MPPIEIHDLTPYETDPATPLVARALVAFHLALARTWVGLPARDPFERLRQNKKEAPEGASSKLN